MGTSTHNGGQKGGTPLVPSWLEQPNENTPSEITPDSDNTEVSPLGDADRVRTPR